MTADEPGYDSSRSSTRMADEGVSFEFSWPDDVSWQSDPNPDPDSRPLVSDLSTAEVVREALVALRRDMAVPVEEPLVPGLFLRPGPTGPDYPHHRRAASVLRNKQVAKPSRAVPKHAAPRPAEPKPAERKPAERKPAEPKPAEPKPAEPKPAEPKPAQPKPADPRPAEPHPAATGQAAPRHARRRFAAFSRSGRATRPVRPAPPNLPTRQGPRHWRAWLAATAAVLSALAIGFAVAHVSNQSVRDGQPPSVVVGLTPEAAPAVLSGTPSDIQPPAPPATEPVGSGPRTGEATAMSSAGAVRPAAALIPDLQQPAVVSSLSPDDLGFGWPTSAFGSAGG